MLSCLKNDLDLFVLCILTFAQQHLVPTLTIANQCVLLSDHLAVAEQPVTEQSVAQQPMAQQPVAILASMAY